MKEFTKEEHLRILEAFRNGANIKEVALELNCWFQDIADWMAQGENLKMVQKMELSPNWEAKKKIVKAISDGDLEKAKWWLERMDPAFKPKQDLTSGDERILINLNV